MLTAEQIQQLVSDGKVYDLGQPLANGLPKVAAHAPFMFNLLHRHGDATAPSGQSGANEMIVIGGHSGTHIDGLGHVSEHGKLFGNVDIHGAQAGGNGLRTHGMETVRPIVSRGLLLDVAGFKGVERLEPAEPVTGEDLAATARQQGVDVRPGDVVLIRTGWIRHWSDAPIFQGDVGGSPGPDPSAADWLVARQVPVVGADTLWFEVRGPNIPGGRVHVILIPRNGVHIIENLNLDELARDRVYEFLFVASPLKIVGGTGSPIRPIAIA